MTYKWCTRAWCTIQSRREKSMLPAASRIQDPSACCKVLQLKGTRTMLKPSFWIFDTSSAVIHWDSQVCISTCASDPNLLSRVSLANLCSFMLSDKPHIQFSVTSQPPRLMPRNVTSSSEALRSSQPLQRKARSVWAAVEEVIERVLDKLASPLGTGCAAQSERKMSVTIPYAFILFCAAASVICQAQYKRLTECLHQQLHRPLWPLLELHQIWWVLKTLVVEPQMRPAKTQMSSSCVGCAFASQSCRSDYEINQTLHPRTSNNRSSPRPHGYCSKHHESGDCVPIRNILHKVRYATQPVADCTCISARLKLGFWNVPLNTCRMQHTSGVRSSCISQSRKLLTLLSSWNVLPDWNCTYA